MARRRTTFDFTTRRGRRLFYQSATWRNFRAAFLRESPWCGPCWAEERVEPAVDLHHVKALARFPDLALEVSNCQGLCKSHHARLTRRGE